MPKKRKKPNDDNGNGDLRRFNPLSFVPQPWRKFVGTMMALGVIMTSVYAIHRGLPIAASWWKGLVSWTITDELETKLEEAEKRSETCLTEIMDLRSQHNQDMRQMAKAQEDQNKMIYNVWSDVRAMNGGPPPPTPVPVPTPALAERPDSISSH